MIKDHQLYRAHVCPDNAPGREEYIFQRIFENQALKFKVSLT